MGCRAIAGARPTGQEASDTAGSNGPYKTGSRKDSRKEYGVLEFVCTHFYDNNTALCISLDKPHLNRRMGMSVSELLSDPNEESDPAPCTGGGLKPPPINSGET
ncbi:hypothetical protein EYF80_024670 [Liparis tanakae]|uniref:Uncharacterized protein n=1 Tax=Liparis tanakae TaxID=230148 RepID=A0A4Z2HHH5_9TELE|nr:hypothetical protein EYF80_024670 [Liparis tanakae]